MKPLAIAAFLLVCYLIVGTCDYRDKAAAAAERKPVSLRDTFPRPRCPGEWIMKQADGGKWTGHCLKTGVRS